MCLVDSLQCKTAVFDRRQNWLIRKNWPRRSVVWFIFSASTLRCWILFVDIKFKFSKNIPRWMKCLSWFFNRKDIYASSTEDVQIQYWEKWNIDNHNPIYLRLNARFLTWIWLSKKYGFYCIATFFPFLLSGDCHDIFEIY